MSEAWTVLSRSSKLCVVVIVCMRYRDDLFSNHIFPAVCVFFFLTDL